MTELNFKRITEENWLDCDEVMLGFVKESQGGLTEPMSENDWVRMILRPTLTDAVPAEVRDLFEVARGAMAYAFFFYPLWTLGSEQLFRVAEAGILHKCQMFNAPKSTKRFADQIEWLVAKGIISERDTLSWTSIRDLRNAASHPKLQSIFSSGMALGSVGRVAEMINSLFDHG